MEDRVDVVVAVGAVSSRNVVGVGGWIHQHGPNVVVPRVRHVEEQRAVGNRSDAVDDLECAGDARRVVVRNRRGRVFGLVDAQGLSHCTRGRVRGHLAIRVGAVHVAIAVVVDVVIADRFVLGAHAWCGACAVRIRFNGAHRRATIVVRRVVVVADFAILDHAIAADAQHADAWCTAAIVVWLDCTRCGTTIVAGHVVVVANFAKLDRAVAAYGRRSNAQHELPVVEGSVIRRFVQVGDVERPRAVGAQTDERSERIFWCITRTEWRIGRCHRRDVRGTRRIEHGVGEVDTSAATSVDRDVLRRVRCLENHADVPCVGVRDVERYGCPVDNACARTGDVDRTREEIHVVRDSRGNMRRTEDEQVFIRGTCLEVCRQLAIRISAVGLSVHIVVDAVAACCFRSATNAGRTCTRESRLRRTRRRTAVTVNRVVVVAGFSGVDGAVAATRHAEAWRAGANESGFDGTRGRTAIEVEDIAVVAQFAGVECSIAAAQLAHTRLSGAFPTHFDCAQ